MAPVEEFMEGIADYATYKRRMDALNEVLRPPPAYYTPRGILSDVCKLCGQLHSAHTAVPGKYGLWTCPK